MSEPLSKFQEALKAGEKFEPEKPQPLSRKMDPADLYPVEALGEILEPAARAVQARTLAPMALAGQSVLGAAVLSVQGFKDIELPTGQIKPISCFFLSIAGTGERKTACDTLALQPINRFEKEHRQKHAEAERVWANKKDIYEKECAKIKNGKKTMREKEQALDEMGHAPKAPHLPVITSKDATIEGLILFMTRSRPSVGLFNGEGGQFIGGHSMSEEAKIRTSTALSHLWDGSPVDRLRATDGYVYLAGRRLAMHLMAQPDIAAEMLSDRTLLDQGLLSRFLVTAPDSTAGTRFFTEPDPECYSVLRDYNEHLYALLTRKLPTEDEDEDVLALEHLKLSEEARKLWIDYTNNVEAQLYQGGPLDSVRGLANKIPEHAARLAGVLTLVADPDALYVSAPAMSNGITLAEHYMAEALRMFSCQRKHYRLRLAEETLKWLHEDWMEDVIGLPDLYQLGPNAIRDKDTAYTIVRVLEDHGWVTEIPGGTHVRDKKRKQAWRIVEAELEA